MRAGCLLAVLVLAKLLILTGTHRTIGGLAPFAYLWQDVLVALVAGVVDALLRRPRSGWAVYGILLIYIAWGVPIAIVLGSPMTWSIIRAARGPLADSVAYYFTFANVCRAALVTGVGAMLPFVLARLMRSRPRFEQAKWRWAAAALATGFVAAGPMAASHVETAGLDRNAITALAPVRLPRVGGSATTDDWRTSPFPDRPRAAGDEADVLSRFRSSAKGFNVIVIVLESTAAQYLRPYGGAPDPRVDPMPNLTALSNHAILFENAYVTYPESIKGLFSTLCSQYPAFGVTAEVHAESPCAPAASQLSAAGYRTALFHSGRFGYLGMDAVIAHKGFDLMEDAGAIGGNVHSSFGVDEPATVNRMLNWIDARPPATPFFALYLPVAGHHPYATLGPGPFPADSELNRYKNALHDGDKALGSLISGLQSRGLDDRTVLMVFGDHGEAFGQHPGNIGHTFFIHEENIRVPYLIVVPGATKEETRVTGVASLIDTAPTLMDLLGLPQPANYQGASLLRPGARMALFFTDYSLGLLGLRDGCWKYIFEINAGTSKLFDVCQDPGETINVSPAQADRVSVYRSRVTQWSAAQQVRIER